MARKTILAGAATGSAFEPAEWNQITFGDVGSSTTPAVAPASPAAVVVEAASTG